jgi:glutamate dehydrogenase
MAKNSSDMNAICSQLLTPKDLKISEQLFNEVQEETIVTQIVDNGDSKSIKIYSTYQLFLSSITPILHDIGFMIIDEVTYNIRNGKDLILIYPPLVI